MANLDVTKAQKTLLNLIGHNLFSSPLDLDGDVNWDAVLQESKAQTVFLIAFNEYRSLPLGEELTAYLRKHLKKGTFINLNCFQGHKYLHEMMTKHGIPYCVVKGVASARYYPAPLLRSMGDVDFYVAPQYLDRAREALLADGFTLEPDDHPHHLSFIKGMFCFELHFAPIGSPTEEMKPLFLEYWSDICDEAHLKKDELAEYVLPSDFHHGFILLSHFRSHLLTSGIGLRHVCDWAVFANTLSNEEFVSVFEHRLKRAGLWRLAQILSLSAVKHLGMPYKPWMGENHDVADAMIEEILHSGNFGRRSEERGHGNMFVSNTVTIAENKSRLFRLFCSMNDIVRNRWHVVKKCPLLYPVGWIYFSFLFLCKVVTGRRKLHLVSSYREGGKRIVLFKSLKLLEPEE